MVTTKQTRDPKSDGLYEKNPIKLRQVDWWLLDQMARKRPPKTSRADVIRELLRTARENILLTTPSFRKSRFGEFRF